MDKKFLNNWALEQQRLIEIARKHELEVDFRDSKYLMDLCFVYLSWPKQAYWKDIFEWVLKLSREDISEKNSLNKVKQWTNRYFERAIKDGLVRKTSSLSDKRVVVFEWTDKGLLLLKEVFGV